MQEGHVLVEVTGVFWATEGRLGRVVHLGTQEEALVEQCQEVRGLHF